MNRYVAVVGALAVGVLAAGCGTETGTPTTAAPPPDPFNVCSELSDETLEAAGLDPATKNVITDPPTGPSTWRVCSWDPVDSAATYRAEVYSTSYTLEDSREHAGMTDFSDTTIAGREGLTFREKSDQNSSCRAAFGAEQGSFIVTAAWLETGKKPDDLCGLAVEYLTDLAPALPK